MNPETGSSATDAPHTVPVHIAATSSSTTDFENLVPGARWRELYRIGEQSPDITFGKAFKAHHEGLMADVVIRTFLVGDDLRKRTWTEIQQAKSGGLLELIEAVEDKGRRIEVIRAAPALTLREWLAQHKASPAEIESLVRQLSKALGALHKHGVVHLNLRSDTVFVRAVEGGLTVLLGGFETATLMQGDGPVELSLDPFYAPPEAVGLYHYTREPALRAWDWWSLGRVIQEVVLGRHILGQMLGRSVLRETPELRARAENLLKEQDGTTRPGAVELMPAMDRDLTTLLRGLLAGARDGRWGLPEVESWLRKEPVKDRYNLPRNERLFFWKDRAYAVSEAAAFFSRAEHWQEGETNLFEPSNPATLAYFLGTESAHKRTKERFDVLMKLGETPALKSLPAGIVNSVVMAVVLKFLAGNDAPLLLCGHRIDETCLKQLLRPEAQPGGLNTVYGFTACSVVQQIEQFDAETARTLGGLGRLYEEALVLARRHHWLPLGDIAGMAVLMDLCLEPEPALRTKHAEMQKIYACSRDQELDRLFNKRDPNHVELVVIAFTLLAPAQFGYVTHKEWNGDRYRVLSERGEKLAAAGLWLELGRALKPGSLVFGRWLTFIPVWGLLALAMAGIGQNRFAYVGALVCPVVMLLVRMIGFWLHRRAIQLRFEGSSPWTLQSGWARCRKEALIILGADTVPSPKAVMQSLSEINAEIATLPLQPKPEPIAHPPRFAATKTLGLASWALVLALAAGTVWRGISHPPTMPSNGIWGARPSAAQGPGPAVESVPSPAAEPRPAQKEAAPLARISWPFKTPSEGKFVGVHETQAALPAQTAAAEEMVRLLTSRYEPATINATVAVQVPSAHDVGLMLYNGRTGKLSDKQVYLIGYVPFPRSWIEIDGMMALFFVE